MNKIIEFDPSTSVLQCEAGCILEDLQDYLMERNHTMPLDLGAKGTCMIGGNLATNAGGIHFIKHNSMHANTVGLKAVLANGKLLDSMTTLRKDNTGYDLKHLFIGAEGTLGVITEAAILCPPLLKHKNLALLACNSFEDVLQLLAHAKTELGDVINAFEVMDKVSVDIVLDKFADNAHFPFEEIHPFYALVEIASNQEATEDSSNPDLEKLFSFVENQESNILDGVIAQDKKQAQHIWFVREQIGNAGVALGYCLKYDVSLPASSYYTIVDDTRKFIEGCSEFSREEKDAILTNGHGHVGDGNLHLNIII